MDLFLLGNIIFDDNEENELQIRRMREEHVKINNFYENVVLHYSLTGKCNLCIHIYTYIFTKLNIILNSDSNMGSIINNKKL